MGCWLFFAGVCFFCDRIRIVQYASTWNIRFDGKQTGRPQKDDVPRSIFIPKQASNKFRRHPPCRGNQTKTKNQTKNQDQFGRFGTRSYRPTNNNDETFSRRVVYDRDGSKTTIQEQPTNFSLGLFSSIPPNGRKLVSFHCSYLLKHHPSSYRPLSL